MNREKPIATKKNIQVLITILFLFIFAAMVSLVAIYWLFILEPRLKLSVESNYRVVATLQAKILADILSMPVDNLTRNRLIRAIENMLLLEDPVTKRPFIVKMSMTLDYDVIKTRNGTLDVELGDVACKDCIVTQVPLYMNTTKELIGLIVVYCSSESFNRLTNDVRVRLFTGLAIILVLLFVGWLATYGLISEQKRLTGRLVKSHTYIENIMSSIHDAILIIDKNGVILSINEHLTQMLGFQEEEIITSNLNTIIKGDDSDNKDFVKEIILTKLINNEIVGNLEILLMRKDGQSVSVLLSASNISESVEQTGSIICIARDITDIKAKEMEIQEKNTQLVHAGRLSALGEMSTGVAHELNQPLTIIRLAAEGIRKYFTKNLEPTEGNAPNVKMEFEAINEIISQVKRATTVINNMRSFARLNVNDYEPIDLSETLDKALSFFREQFRLHAIDLTVTVGEKVPKVRLNSQKFEQIVVNILTNARYALDKKDRKDYTGYKKFVALRLFLSNEIGKAILEIQDNGIGMSEDVRRRCFEPFYTTKDVGEGTGLGLTIVNSIAREFGLTIEVESTEGQGSVFRILIPI
ncbi:MAG: PAS domain S-box protein [Nitrospirae bacterium]|nr:PAS domain S-box protein [Nitrospirota bacterium]